MSETACFFATSYSATNRDFDTEKLSFRGSVLSCPRAAGRGGGASGCEAITCSDASKSTCREVADGK